MLQRGEDGRVRVEHRATTSVTHAELRDTRSWEHKVKLLGSASALPLLRDGRGALLSAVAGGGARRKAMQSFVRSNLRPAHRGQHIQPLGKNKKGTFAAQAALAGHFAAASTLPRRVRKRATTNRPSSAGRLRTLCADGVRLLVCQVSDAMLMQRGCAAWRTWRTAPPRKAPLTAFRGCVAACAWCQRACVALACVTHTEQKVSCGLLTRKAAQLRCCLCATQACSAVAAPAPTSCRAAARARARAL
jgi:hypothetical protein